MSKIEKLIEREIRMARGEVRVLQTVKLAEGGYCIVYTVRHVPEPHIRVAPWLERRAAIYADNGDPITSVTLGATE